MEPFPVVIFCALLALLASPLPGRPAAKLLNDTLSPDTYGQAFNIDNPFVFPLPFALFLVLSQPHFNRTHSTFNEPFENETREEIGGYWYHRSQECGVHFINQGEGYIINNQQAAAATADNEAERCVWGFVGNRFCTPSIHCPSYELINGTSNCRTDYLQITDGGESFVSHYCENATRPENITAARGILDVSYRGSNIQFECLVKCAPYQVNLTAMMENPGKYETKTPTVRKEKNMPEIQRTNKCRCGRSNGYKYRIVGGRETSVSQYPWMAAILNEGKKRPFCGGSLINDRYVLTAAHCMEDESVEDLVVVLNEHDFENETETVGGALRVGVAEIIPFHYYLESTFYGDVALLRLAQPVDISNFTLTPICLPHDEARQYEESSVIGAGWGTLMEGGEKSAKLQEVIMRVYSNVACNDYHNLEPHFPPQITDNMLCAGYPEGGRDTCAGDSGGPLFTFENRRFSQVGVTSWGFGCGNRLNPGVFSRTTAFLYWIRANTLDAVWCDDDAV